MKCFVSFDQRLPIAETNVGKCHFMVSRDKIFQDFFLSILAALARAFYVTPTILTAERALGMEPFITGV